MPDASSSDAHDLALAAERAARALGPDPLGAMDIGDEHLLHVLQCPQEGRFLAVTGINADPCEPHPASPRLAHDIQSMFAFRGQLARRRRDPGRVASRRILDPGVRQVEPHIDRRVPLAVGQHAEHRDLAVVHLAQPPGPLPGHANRTIALLGEAAFVDDQAAHRRAAEEKIRVPSDLRHHRPVVPRRVADEMLELLRAAALNHGGHRGQRAILGLRQSAQITRSNRHVVPRAGAEETAVAIDQRCERLRNTIHQRRGQPSSEHEVT